MDLRIIFMGTPDFSVPSLERLVDAGYAPVAAVTAPDRAQGRGRKVQPSPVKRAARRLGIEHVLQPESVKDESFARAVAELMPDIIVVVAFKILPPAVYESASRGAFNLHGSLLPAYRGAAPIHRAVLAGESRTGVTTFFLKRAVDTGDVILQREMTIAPDETTGDVHDRMMLLGADVVVATVRLIEAGDVTLTAQDDSAATPAPKIFRAQALVDWTLPALHVHNHIRGMSPVPGAFTVLHGRTIKMLRSKPVDMNGEPGVVLEADEHLVIACGSGAVEIQEVQAEGRKRMSAGDFLRGGSISSGDRLADS